MLEYVRMQRVQDLIKKITYTFFKFFTIEVLL